MNRALVVGCAGYEDPDIAPLRYADRDAARVGALLQQVCGIPDEGLILLHDGLDDPRRRPTRTNLLRHLTQLSQTADDGILYFFFSGHGFQTRSGEHYLLPVDCVRGAIEETALRFESVVRYLGSAGAPHLVLLLDACRNVVEGGKSAGGPGLSTVDVDALCPPGVVTFCSCRPGHVSYEAERLAAGVFTEALCEALSDQGRCRTVYELSRYLAQRVPQIAVREGKPAQQPHSRVEPLGVQHLEIVSERTRNAWGSTVPTGVERRTRTVPRLPVTDPDPLIGIDFGTSYSVVSYCRPDGGTTLIPGPDGRPLVPSVVHFLPDLDYLVGSAAVEADHYRPGATVRQVKRELGSGHGYEVDGRSLSPEFVAGLILRSLKRNAEEALGTTVRRCVASRPANFTHRQNEELERAFAAAGLEVVRMLGEPNVAPLALDDVESEDTVLVVDLGGGTFDVALVEVGMGLVEVKAAAGSNHVGGLDFDRAIVALAEERLRGVHGWTGPLPVEVAAALRREAERAKRELTSRDSATLVLQDLDYGDRGLRDVSIELTRAAFRAVTAELTATIRATLEQPFRDAHLPVERWLAGGAVIVLAGQGSKIFTVREQLDALFPGARLVAGYQETAVAHGLSRQAGVLTGRVKDGLLLDVVPFGVGLRVQRSVVGSGPEPAQAVIAPDPVANTEIAVLLEKHTTAPTRHVRQLHLAGPVGAPHPLEIVELPAGSANVFGRIDLRAPQHSAWLTLDVDANQTVRVILTDNRDDRHGATYQLNHRGHAARGRPADPPLPPAR